MLSTPGSLGFVLAVILGAMLVPGCRPENASKPPVQRRTGPESFLGRDPQFRLVLRTGTAGYDVVSRGVVLQAREPTWRTWGSNAS